MLEPSLNQREEQCKQHMHKVGQQWKEKNIRSAKGEWRKKKDKDLQILQEMHKGATKD